MTQPLSERYRLAALDWVDKDAAARLLEETKTAVLSQRKSALGEMADARAERLVKATPEWDAWIKRMVDARTVANRAKVNMEYLRMKFAEQQSAEATARAEMKLC
jgi:hypothetical protein